LESQFNQARNDGIAQQQRLADARLDFTSELEKLRLAGQLADERFRACETRALLEIDRERGTCAKLQKELDTTRTAATQSEERMRSEIGTLQGQLGDLRQSVGTLEGKPKLRLACRQSGACQLMSNLSACGGTTPRSRRRTKFQKNWPFTFCGSRNEAPVHRVNFRSAATPITSSSAANRSKVCRYELSNKCPVAVTGKSYREIPAS